ncbi:hypothetical protein AB0M12_22850 [Nocardia vinacea]|uniref:hypothetical protein n=1 Tax=Nocardia vinacea TaxID=96468 RepID=UPI00342AF0A3
MPISEARISRGGLAEVLCGAESATGLRTGPINDTVDLAAERGQIAKSSPGWAADRKNRAMSAGVVSTLVTGLMPLLGAGLGASTTLLVQRSSAREAKLKFLAESRLSHREELKSAILDYFETAQRLQGELDVRERGGTPDDLKRMIESLWLAEKRVEIICSDALRDCVIAHTRGLHDAVRDPVDHPDWWAHCRSLQSDLIAQAKAELSRVHDW